MIDLRGGDKENPIDLLVVGAGPTGIAIGAEAVRDGLSTLLIDRGPLTANIQAFPTFMTFFTTRDLLEIADVPFSVPEDKPDRRQALAYYRGVVERYGLPLALHEEVVKAERLEEHLFRVESSSEGEERLRWARAVALATGYFHIRKTLDVPGEDLPWVRGRYLEAYPHYGERVVVVGGGNSAAETALDLYRNGARVTLVHRGSGIKKTVKYWVKPDIENRIEEGAIEARFNSRVTAFRPGGEVEIETDAGAERLRADAAYILIGYLVDAELERRCGVEVDPESLVPRFDADTCESNVPGLYLAGTLQAGARTDRIFIENSRDHGQRIVRHLRSALRPEKVTSGS